MKLHEEEEIQLHIFVEVSGQLHIWPLCHSENSLPSLLLGDE